MDGEDDNNAEASCEKQSRVQRHVVDGHSLTQITKAFVHIDSVNRSVDDDDADDDADVAPGERFLQPLENAAVSGETGEVETESTTGTTVKAIMVKDVGKWQTEHIPISNPPSPSSSDVNGGYTSVVSFKDIKFALDEDNYLVYIDCDMGEAQVDLETFVQLPYIKRPTRKVKIHNNCIESWEEKLPLENGKSMDMMFFMFRVGRGIDTQYEGPIGCESDDFNAFIFSVNTMIENAVIQRAQELNRFLKDELPHAPTPVKISRADERRDDEQFITDFFKILRIGRVGFYPQFLHISKTWLSIICFLNITDRSFKNELLAFCPDVMYSEMLMDLITSHVLKFVSLN